MRPFRFALAAAIAIATAPVADATSPAPSYPLPASPAALEERLPPLPGPGAYTWLPGRWSWTGVAGVEWQWQPGRYVAWPPAHTTAIDVTEPLPSGWATRTPETD